MKKIDVVKAVSQKTNITQDAVAYVLDGLIETLNESLANGETICLRGLFTLSTIKRKKKVTRDIHRKKSIISPAHYVPFAKFSKELCEKVRKIPVENNN